MFFEAESTLVDKNLACRAKDLAAAFDEQGLH